MSPLVIAVERSPSPEDIGAVARGMRAHALAQIEGAESPPIACFAREDGSMVGGAVGRMIKQRLFVELLWVEEARRHRGIGTSLLQAMEAAATEGACRDVLLETLSSSAAALYESLGYRPVAEVPDYIPGFVKYVLVKQLASTQLQVSPSGEVTTMPESDNAALARRWFDDLWNKRQEATVHELLDPAAVGHLEGLVSRGIDEFLQARSYILTGFPDIRITVEDTVTEGDNVVVRWSAAGTHRGELLDVPATGKPVSFRGLTWLRFANGRIVEGWDAWNQGRVMAELRAAAEGRSRGSA